MVDLFNSMPTYYNGKEVKVVWVCNEFNLVEILFVDIGERLVVDSQAISNSSEVEHYISSSLFANGIL